MKITEGKTPEKTEKRFGAKFWVDFDDWTAGVSMGIAFVALFNDKIEMAIFWVLVAIFCQMPPRTAKQSKHEED